MLVSFCAAPGVSRAFAQSNNTGDGSFYLSVRMNDIYNSDLQIFLRVKINKPFKVTAENGDVKTTISGTILGPKEGKYPLSLMVSEWVDEKNNLSGWTDLQLELNKPFGYGPVSSIVYFRTVTLSKNRKPL